jgi:hypothetical protein
VAGEQQRDRKPRHGADGDHAARRHARGEGVTLAPVLGVAALAQPGGERGAAGGPAVERRGVLSN